MGFIGAQAEELDLTGHTAAVATADGIRGWEERLELRRVRRATLGGIWQSIGSTTRTLTCQMLCRVLGRRELIDNDGRRLRCHSSMFSVTHAPVGRLSRIWQLIGGIWQLIESCIVLRGRTPLRCRRGVFRLRYRSAYSRFSRWSGRSVLRCTDKRAQRGRERRRATAQRLHGAKLCYG